MLSQLEISGIDISQRWTQCPQKCYPFFMKILLLSFVLSFSAYSQNTCEVDPVDFLMIGDSQTGATWATGYFGNYLQKCLKEKAGLASFAIYARGGTQPIHWLTSAGLDKIETIQRDETHNHLNLGTTVPLCKKRIVPMLEAHNPTKFMAFFGDNLLSLTPAEIQKQFKDLVNIVKAKNISYENCYFLTPTYEMEVRDRRNVPGKNLANTQKVIENIKAVVADHCQIIDGLELMKSSRYFKDNLLKRIQRSDGAGCIGASSNDNIHLCGEAAFDFANRVCEALLL